MRRKYREPEPMRRVAVYEDEESMQPRKRRILFPVLITLFSVIFVVSAAVLVIELIVNPYVTDKNVGEIQKIYSEAGDTESVVPATSEDDTADSERMAELERRCEAVLKLQSVNSDITGWVQLDGAEEARYTCMRVCFGIGIEGRTFATASSRDRSRETIS